MASSSGVVKRNDQMELPPGFRFHPTDEELITHYLSKKVVDSNFSAIAIGEVDMNKVEPWELPWRAKVGEKEWYFFCVRDKKYPTGLRTNRATAAGYWKATGKDKEIFRGRALVGMKKTLVFYKGRAPKGEKTNWVTHEYRLEGKLSLDNLPKPVKNDWVISRVFQKTSGGKKVHISGLMRMNAIGNEQMAPSPLPPLMDHSPSTGDTTKPDEPESDHVHCFSNPTVFPHKIQQDLFSNQIFPPVTNMNPIENPFSTWGQFPSMGSSIPLQDPSILRTLLGNYGQNMNQMMDYRKENEMVSVSQETALSTENSSVLSNLEMGKKSFEEQQAPSASVGVQDLECIWGY